MFQQLPFEISSGPVGVWCEWKMSCLLQGRTGGRPLHSPGFTVCGVRTPNTLPPPGDSLVPIMSVFPAGLLRVTPEASLCADPVVPAASVSEPSLATLTQHPEKIADPKLVWKNKGESRLLLILQSRVERKTFGAGGQRTWSEAPCPTLFLPGSRGQVLAHRGSLSPRCVPCRSWDVPP